ncbi:NAD-dependent epimerase/dehydratase family protein [Paraflavitalea sp. CAU 1676]|uniref:NAD-dependent epimerase/dehydratase family protein n=1 Tax=Paraflavitalea sp. CAU 1676 TaxID=3032598 RepID=UPI0023DBAF7B|nr:NAD-dependent epimerase/dehydratase family protein [Paraflavitalea sp. CAU 1676]MDF2187097.1 NAD-dependent epimerase/dehydratase family protein [Paraflavitalea sp. CAU 1676]
MKKVLITGANGFLGTNLAWQLFRQGFEIKILVRPGADLQYLSGIPLHISYGRIDHAEQVQEAVAGCQYVVHAAAITDQWGIGFEEYDRINFKGTRNIVEACLHHKVEKLIYVSTANTMGPGTMQTPATELDGFTLFSANSGYINSKYLAQQYVLEQVQARQLPAVVVNPTFMIGPRDHKPSSGKLLLHGVHKKLLWYPPGGKNFVYIDDVCQGIINAIQLGQAGNCYLLAGHNLTYGEFFRLLRTHTRQKQRMIRIPRSLLLGAGLLGNLKGLLTGKAGKLTWSGARLLSLDNYYSGKKATSELNIQYTSMDIAISNALTWFRANKYF